MASKERVPTKIATGMQRLGRVTAVGEEAYEEEDVGECVGVGCCRVVIGREYGFGWLLRDEEAPEEPHRGRMSHSRFTWKREARERDREGGTTGAMGGWPVRSFGMIRLRHGRNEKPPSMTH